MNRGLRKRRDAAAARHDAALARFPSREGPAFQAELKSVMEELSAIMSEADVRSSDAVELAKTQRWLGDACFDLGRGTDDALLARGAGAYARADELLASAEAPVEKAKLDFNYANTLRGLSLGFDVGLLEAADTRYESAACAFRTHHLEPLAETVEAQRRTLDPQLRLARKHATLRRQRAELEDLARRAGSAGPVEREEIARAAGALREAVPNRDDLRETLDDALAVARGLFPPAPIGDGARGRLAELCRLAEELAGMLPPPSAVSPLPGGAGPGEKPVGATPQAVAALLRERLRQDEEAKTVSNDRAAVLGEVLAKFMNVAAGCEDDLPALAAKVDEMRALTHRIVDLVQAPSWPTPPPPAGSRAARLATVLAPLKRCLLGEQGRAMQPAQEKAATFDLLTRLMTLEPRIRELASDEGKLGDAEDATWRLARDVLDHARRHHLMLATPIFPTAASVAAPRTVFLSGGPELRAAAHRLVALDRLNLLEDATRGDRGRERWNQLCSATLAVFDVGVPQGAARAQVCYELGLAFALGKPTVITSRAKASLPFDIELQPIALTGDAALDAPVLRDALFRSLGAIVWGGSEAHLGRGPANALDWLERRFRRRLSHGAPGVGVQLARRAADDAVAFRGALARVLGTLGADAPTALLPAWPPAYPPADGERRLFHVTPFGPPWAAATREIARAACQSRGWTYSRGDELEEQRVIRGIWTEIGRSSAVLVDLTGLNANVALELGLVHALGRPFRILTQGNPGIEVFESVAKLQVHAYGGGQGHPGLGGEVEALLASAEKDEASGQ